MNALSDALRLTILIYLAPKKKKKIIDFPLITTKQIAN
jgi:hypothetical protein